MTILTSFNKTARGKRQVVLDTETTGIVHIDPKTGKHIEIEYDRVTGLPSPKITEEGVSRIVSIGLLEMVDGKLTGKSLYKVVNPEMTMSDFIISIHGITNEAAAKEPVFSAYAKEIRDFIGNSQVIITCRAPSDDFTLDIALLNMEMEKAGQPQIPADQWLNVRRWSEEMFGDKAAKLDAVLDHYGISREQRIDDGHGSLLDAQLLAEVYPKLRDDYEAFSKKAKPANNPSLKSGSGLKKPQPSSPSL